MNWYRSRTGGRRDGIRMNSEFSNFEMRVATSEEDVRAAQRLRYRVFVEEMGAGGEGVDDLERLETDEFDKISDHLILIDNSRQRKSLDHVVGAYRLLGIEAARANNGFYTESEYDITLLKECGRPIVELGRSCVHPDYRSRTVMLQLWSGLAEYVLNRELEILFGVASFHGNDLSKFDQPLSYLHYNHLAPSDLRVRALDGHYNTMQRLRPDDVNAKQALKSIPILLKGYLRLGAFIGDGAFVDRAFNTIDVCVIIDTNRMSDRHRGYYVRNWSKP